MKLSVVVPSHNDQFGLWTTYVSSHNDLAAHFDTSDFEFIAVIDNETEPNLTVDSFRQFGTCRIMQGNYGGPQNARRAGAFEANGDYVAFLDSHVVPEPGMFRSLVDAAESTGACIVHAPHKFWIDYPRCYCYKMDLYHRFWVSNSVPVPHSDKPYPVAAMGHGVILVNKEKYFKIGGYTDLQRGWGGEEPYLNLKAWMLGETCYTDPRTAHWHYMNTRRTAEVYKQVSYVRNFMIAAYVIGGQKFLDRVYALHTFTANRQTSVEAATNAEQIDPYRPALESIPIEATEERKIVEAGPFAGDLEKLLAWFDANDIPR